MQRTLVVLVVLVCVWGAHSYKGNGKHKPENRENGEMRHGGHGGGPAHHRHEGGFRHGSGPHEGEEGRQGHFVGHGPQRPHQYPHPEGGHRHGHFGEGEGEGEHHIPHPQGGDNYRHGHFAGHGPQRPHQYPQQPNVPPQDLVPPQQIPLTQPDQPEFSPQEPHPQEHHDDHPVHDKCFMCHNKEIMFHEDAFYFWNAQNSVTFSRNLSVGFERGDDTIFCNHEKKLHARWHEEVSQEEFMKQCSFEYKNVDSILQENAPFNPFLLAHKNCVEQALCSADIQPPEEDECHSCFERNVVFGEDVKMFTSYLSGIDDPKSSETVNIFCNAEAILHSNWVIGGDLDGFLSACHRDYLRIVNHNDGPLDICPFGFAHRACARACGGNYHQGPNQNDEKFMRKKHHMMQEESHHERRQSSKTGPHNVHNVHHYGHPHPEHKQAHPHSRPQVHRPSRPGTIDPSHQPFQHGSQDLNPHTGPIMPNQRPNQRPIQRPNQRPVSPNAGPEFNNLPIVQSPNLNAPNDGQTATIPAIPIAESNVAQPINPQTAPVHAGPHRPTHGRPHPHRPVAHHAPHGNANHNAPHKNAPHNNAPHVPNQQMNAGQGQVAPVVPLPEGQAAPVVPLPEGQAQ